MNILVAIERLKEIALIHPDAFLAGFDYRSEDYVNPATDVVYQADIFDMEVGVYFEYQRPWS